MTGGGSGIGRATALALVGAGYDTVVVGRRLGELAATAAAVEAPAGAARCLPLAADLTTDEGLRRVREFVYDQYGHLDVLVNNAAVAAFGPLNEFSPESVSAHLELNVASVLKLTGALYDALSVPGRAHVINISSEQSLVPAPNRSVYGAGKAALNYITRSLAAEFAPMGIRVNALLPGAVDTAMLRHATGGHAVGTPLGEGLRPADIAEWVLHLVRSWHTTGALITVDGGTSLS
ncbi:SDR family oxidoreductase [Kitasatospora sp. NBC_01560]|uniref:SDR family NAD(P)-dependent oxidoreductase n=1 Tax=Kitasatospora sp. NBC_01560 TaxID=2975965 RepID=UPI00386E827E